MKIRILEPARVAGQVASAELDFEPADGLLSGLKLAGFAVWERRGGGPATFNVTFPARQYSVNGERRSFALLRGIEELTAAWPVRDAIIRAYVESRQASPAGEAGAGEASGARGGATS